MPETPELKQARKAVQDLIKDEITTDEAARIVKHWHLQVKLWEEADSMPEAFKESRLTFRYMIHPDKGAEGQKPYNYKKENPTGNADRETLLGVVNNDR